MGPGGLLFPLLLVSLLIVVPIGGAFIAASDINFDKWLFRAIIASIMLLTCGLPCFLFFRKGETWATKAKQLGFLLLIYLGAAGILAIQSKCVR